MKLKVSNTVRSLIFYTSLLLLVLSNNVLTKNHQVEEKYDELLNNSLLKVPFVNGLVTLEKDIIQINLPFDLHSLDCGAPDCYTTTLNFNIPVSNPLRFPSEINVNYSDKGCYIDNTEKRIINFILIEDTIDFINYYSKSESSYLILFKESKYNNFVYYFANTNGIEIMSYNIDSIFLGAEEDSLSDLIPFTISRSKLKD